MSPTATDVTKGASVTQRYLPMRPGEFRQSVNQTWEAIGNVINAVVEQVENENLRPIDGIKAVSCLTGSTFGYEEFHPRGSSSEMSGLGAALLARDLAS